MSQGGASNPQFGPFIDAAIKAAGFRSPTAFARKAGIQPSVVLRWIRSETDPTGPLLRRAAPHLHVEEAALFVAAFPTGTPPDTPALEPELADLIAEVRAVDDPARAELLQQVRWLVDGARWRRKRR